MSQSLGGHLLSPVRQLDWLEASGLPRRNKGSEDRRVYRLELTEKAMPVIQELWTIADEVEAQVLSVPSHVEQTSLTELLCRVKDSLIDAEH